MNYSQDININININVTARVVLTEYGANVINQYNKSHHISGDAKQDELYFPTHYKEGDPIKRTLWELMMIFGSSISQGGPIVFKANNLKLIEL